MSKYILLTEEGKEIKNSKEILERHFGNSFCIKFLDNLNAGIDGFVQQLFINNKRLRIIRKEG
jgi:hypothetical protein